MISNRAAFGLSQSGNLALQPTGRLLPKTKHPVLLSFGQVANRAAAPIGHHISLSRAPGNSFCVRTGHLPQPGNRERIPIGRSIDQPGSDSDRALRSQSGNSCNLATTFQPGGGSNRASTQSGRVPNRANDQCSRQPLGNIASNPIWAWMGERCRCGRDREGQKGFERFSRASKVFEGVLGSLGRGLRA